MIPRLFAGVGAVILWAYARACRERNATQRRLARANLLRRVTARPTRCADCGRADGGCDRIITVDITPDTTKLDELRVKWSHGDEMPDPFKPPAEPGETWFDSVDELPPALQGVPPEEMIKVRVRQLPDSEGGVPQWLAEVADAELTTWQAAIVQQYFVDAMSIEPGDVEIPVRRGFESPERKGYPW